IIPAVTVNEELLSSGSTETTLELITRLLETENNVACRGRSASLILAAVIESEENAHYKTSPKMRECVNGGGRRIVFQ
ncbi:hypothetical protein PFISCL1PPCAC_14445, partial [Pristionchus fissidentatus]